MRKCEEEKRSFLRFLMVTILHSALKIMIKATLMYFSTVI